jgi:hypothetical protein
MTKSTGLPVNLAAIAARSVPVKLRASRRIDGAFMPIANQDAHDGRGQVVAGHVSHPVISQAGEYPRVGGHPCIIRIYQFRDQIYSGTMIYEMLSHDYAISADRSAR